METILSLLTISLLLVIVIIAVLLWAIRGGQFDDLEGPSWRVVMDDDRHPQRNTKARERPKRHDLDQGTDGPQT